MKNVLFTTIICLIFWMSCQNPTNPPAESESTGDEHVEKLPEMSVYHLPGVWTDQDGHDFELRELRGKVLVMVMIYTSCKAACPRLIADMRRIEEQIPEKYGKEVQYVMVSIDPETDTPERLKSFASENEMMDERWMFIRSTMEHTREFASVLAVNYKKISPMDFSHSNIISVFDTEGEMIFQQEGLSSNNEKTIQTIIDLASEMKSVHS